MNPLDCDKNAEGRLGSPEAAFAFVHSLDACATASALHPGYQVSAYHCGYTQSAQI